MRNEIGSVVPAKIREKRGPSNRPDAWRCGETYVDSSTLVPHALGQQRVSVTSACGSDARREVAPVFAKKDSLSQLCLASIVAAQAEGRHSDVESYVIPTGSQVGSFNSRQAHGGDLVRTWIPVCGLSHGAKKPAGGSKNDDFRAKWRSRASPDSAKKALSPGSLLDSSRDSTDTAPW